MDKTDKKIISIIVISIMGFIGLWTVFASAVHVGAGEVGVIDMFGTVEEREVESGWHWFAKHPLAGVHTMSVKQKSIQESATVPSSEGASVKVDVSIIYNILPDRADYIYREIQDIDSYIKTLFRSAMRDSSAKYEAKAMYTEMREAVALDIKDSITPQLEAVGIYVVDIKLRNVELPAKIKDSIDEKLKAEQEAQKMEFILDKERMEAERKVVEAEGIATAQEIINRELTPEYIQYLAIQMYKTLADSPNTTFIIVPTSNEGAGMPLILNAN